jgi:membrane-associated phospholipid phosphatase
MTATLNQNKLLFLGIVFLVCFILIDLLRSDFSYLNSTLNAWAATVNGDFFRRPAEFISNVFDTTALLVFSLIVAGLLFFTHKKRYGLLVLSAMGGAALLVDVSKVLIASQRPLNGVFPETSFSFPSGHVTTTVVLLGILVFISWRYWNSRRVKVLTFFSYVLTVALVGFDRIYLNVHWFSDVAGAVFLGLFWLAICIYTFNLLSHSSLSQVLCYQENNEVKLTAEVVQEA